MTPQALLNALVVQGFQLTSDGENLELTGPLGRLTPALRQAILHSKPELLQLLPVSYEAAEQYAIQHESTAPPEGDDWPVELTWSNLRRAIETGQPEREAIQFADTPAADAALARAIVEWNELTTPPPNCPQCGEMPSWWDIHGTPRCRKCDPNKSERVRGLAKRCRDGEVRSSRPAKRGHRHASV